MRRRAREALVEMHIAFQRTGGFAGMRTGCEINTENLSPEEATQVAAWVDAANFFSLPEVSRSGGADQFQYKISIEKDGRKHTVETDERATPASLSPLVKWLMAAARRSASG
ncbi:MAG TPA: protealysin inhibitor emfourin [Terriglobales bacterium]|nr:protealysin inhibitor emfourin [Terriglobales bacterium]